jgi:hypothetical protein
MVRPRYTPHMAGVSLSLKLDEALEKFATPLWIAFFTVASVVQPPSNHVPDWIIATVAWIVRHVLPLPLDASSTSPVLTVLITAGITGVFCALDSHVSVFLRFDATGVYD